MTGHNNSRSWMFLSHCSYERDFFKYSSSGTNECLQIYCLSFVLFNWVQTETCKHEIAGSIFAVTCLFSLPTSIIYSNWPLYTYTSIIEKWSRDPSKKEEMNDGITAFRLWYGSFTGLLNHLVTWHAHLVIYTCSLSNPPSSNFVHDKY